MLPIANEQALQVAVVNTVQTWACGKKGPLFVAMFKPVQMILAVIMGVSFLQDVLRLGRYFSFLNSSIFCFLGSCCKIKKNNDIVLCSVIGGTIIAIGFYTVMKGKAEEETRKEGVEENGSIYNSETTPDHKVPLLKNKNMDV